MEKDTLGWSLLKIETCRLFQCHTTSGLSPAGSSLQGSICFQSFFFSYFLSSVKICIVSWCRFTLLCETDNAITARCI